MGILLSGYFFWMAASLGVFQNNVGGVIGGVAILVILAILSGRGRWSEIQTWIRDKRRIILITEVVFLVHLLRIVQKGQS